MFICQDCKYLNNGFSNDDDDDDDGDDANLDKEYTKFRAYSSLQLTNKGL